MVNSPSQCSTSAFLIICTEGHIYYEGYAHAKWASRNTPVLSMNPRFGVDYEKPAAPSELMAFAEALRRVNSPLLDALSRRLAALESPCGMALARLIQEGDVFADLAIQQHWGSDEPGIWHNDGVNSLMHFALSVRGSRALLSEFSKTSDPAANLQVRRDDMGQGDCYLTTPALFSHAVQYHDAPTYESRIIAVQFRLLGTITKLGALECRGSPEWLKVSEVINEVLRGAGALALPTQALLESVLEETAFKPPNNLPHHEVGESFCCVS